MAKVIYTGLQNKTMTVSFDDTGANELEFIEVVSVIVETAKENVLKTSAQRGDGVPTQTNNPATITIICNEYDSELKAKLDKALDRTDRVDLVLSPNTEDTANLTGFTGTSCIVKSTKPMSYAENDVEQPTFIFEVPSHKFIEIDSAGGEVLVD